MRRKLVATSRDSGKNYDSDSLLILKELQVLKEANFFVGSHMRLGTVLCGCSSQRAIPNAEEKLPSTPHGSDETLKRWQELRSGVDDIIRKGATCLATVSYPAYKILAPVRISFSVLFEPIISNMGVREKATGWYFATGRVPDVWLHDVARF